MAQKVTDAMIEDDSLQKALWKWQSRFLFRRQAPQEIIKTNREALEGGDDGDDAQMAGAPLLTERVDPKMLASAAKDSDDSDSAGDEAEEDKADDSENMEGEEDADDDDDCFDEVKVCTKHAAFVRFRETEGYFLHYAA